MYNELSGVTLDVLKQLNVLHVVWTPTWEQYVDKLRFDYNTSLKGLKKLFTPGTIEPSNTSAFSVEYSRHAFLHYSHRRGICSLVS